MLSQRNPIFLKNFFLWGNRYKDWDNFEKCIDKNNKGYFWLHDFIGIWKDVQEGINLQTFI